MLLPWLFPQTKRNNFAAKVNSENQEKLLILRKEDASASSGQSELSLVRRQKKAHHNEEDKTADCPRPTLFMFHSFLLTLRLSNTFFASVAFSKIKPLRIPC